MKVKRWSTGGHTLGHLLIYVILMIVKLHTLLLLDLLMKMEKIGYFGCLNLWSPWASRKLQAWDWLVSAQSMESKINCEMDVFTPALCSLDRNIWLMNDVTGKKAVFGHCFVNVKILQLSFSFLGLSYFKLQRCRQHTFFFWTIPELFL